MWITWAIAGLVAFCGVVMMYLASAFGEGIIPSERDRYDMDLMYSDSLAKERILQAEALPQAEKHHTASPTGFANL